MKIPEKKWPRLREDIRSGCMIKILKLVSCSLCPYLNSGQGNKPCCGLSLKLIDSKDLSMGSFPVDCPLEEDLGMKDPAYK